MPTIAKSVQIGGVSFGQQRSVSADGEVQRAKSLSAAKAGSLSTRTDDDTGAITLATGQGASFSVAERVDVYWDIGGVKGHRRGMKVSSIAGDIVTVGTAAGDIGAGDVFPAQTSAVILAKSVQAEIRFDGSDAAVLAVAGDARCIVVLTGDDDLEDHFVHLPIAGSAWVWDSADGTTNPIAGDAITRAYLSHADTGGSKTVKVGAAYN